MIFLKTFYCIILEILIPNSGRILAKIPEEKFCISDVTTSICKIKLDFENFPPVYGWILTLCSNVFLITY